MEKDTRQLAAILLTDVVGYTALTQTDEALSLALLDEQAALIRPLFASYDGREVKCTGDGFLVEFPSALQAVRCAIDIQRSLHERNESAPIDRAIQLRIGVHLGDIVHRGGDIFGDGVNIAARIEPLATPGGICISRQVYDQVWNKVDLQMASLGRKELKNVKVPIEIYQMILPWTRDRSPGASPGQSARLAVLPLVSMSPDTGDEYFADGLTEELIFGLSKVAGLQVIALTSSMKYRGAKKAVAEIAEELSVGAVLEGTVRKSANRLRITMQLIDPAAQSPLWAEAYDRTLDDVLTVQTEIAHQVVSALVPKLAPRHERPPRGRASPLAIAAFLKGRVLLSRRTEENLRNAIGNLENSVAIDPSAPETHAALAMAYGLLPDYSPGAPADIWDKARSSAKTALQLDPELAEAHAAMSLVMANCWEWSDARRELEEAIRLSPSYAVAYHWLGLLLLGFGRFGDAVAALEKAQALDPLSAVLHTAMGQIHLSAGDCERALAEFEMSLALGEDNRILRGFLGETYLKCGQPVLARASFEQAREMSGTFDPFIEFGYARSREATGERGAVEKTLARARGERVSSYWLAAFAFALGRPDEAFLLLEKAFAERDFELITLVADPRLDAWRSDPRYADLVRRMGLAG